MQAMDADHQWLSGIHPSEASIVCVIKSKLHKRGQSYLLSVVYVIWSNMGI